MARWSIWRATARSARAPASCAPGTLRVISCRMNYAADVPEGISAEPEKRTSPATRAAATTTRCCATGCRSSATASPPRSAPFGYRAFTDSAPVMEVELAHARRARLARQAHAAPQPRRRLVVLPRRDLCDLPLPVDQEEQNHCGTCQRCIDVCPTQAIRGPYQLDARRCISYLTIEHKSAIPEELRPLIGNRVYGCDDCQVVCPWNGFAQPTQEKDFAVQERPGPGDAGRAVRLERGRVRRAHAGLGDPAHRLRALAAQPRGGPGQCAYRLPRWLRPCGPG